MKREEKIKTNKTNPNRNELITREKQPPITAKKSTQL